MPEKNCFEAIKCNKTQICVGLKTLPTSIINTNLFFKREAGVYVKVHTTFFPDTHAECANCQMCQIPPIITWQLTLLDENLESHKCGIEMFKYSQVTQCIEKPNIVSHWFTTINILSVITKLPFQKSHFIESWFYSAKVLKYLPQIYFQRRKTPLLVSVWPPLKHGFGIFNIHPWQLLYVKVGFRCATKHFVP